MSAARDFINASERLSRAETPEEERLAENDMKAALSRMVQDAEGRHRADDDDVYDDPCVHPNY